MIAYFYVCSTEWVSEWLFNEIEYELLLRSMPYSLFVYCTSSEVGDVVEV
jgi:hypothetical protein